MRKNTVSPPYTHRSGVQIRKDQESFKAEIENSLLVHLRSAQAWLESTRVALQLPNVVSSALGMQFDRMFKNRFTITLESITGVKVWLTVTFTRFVSDTRGEIERAQADNLTKIEATKEKGKERDSSSKSCPSNCPSAALMHYLRDVETRLVSLLAFSSGLRSFSSVDQAYESARSGQLLRKLEDETYQARDIHSQNGWPTLNACSLAPWLKKSMPSNKVRKSCEQSLVCCLFSMLCCLCPSNSSGDVVIARMLAINSSC